jgi:PIN domain nuclease of toxin-antitoxin system
LGEVSYLLDTHALLWWLFDDRRLSRRARGVISDPENRLLASGASAWEIATKHRLGKLSSAGPLVSDFGGFMVKAGFSELAVSWAHAVRAGAWDVAHRDPFDRMLAAQASLDSLTLITADPAFDDFGISAVW